MELSVVITREGKVSVFAKTGTFALAKEKIEQLFKDLGLEGIDFEVVSEVERHAHDRPEIHETLGQRIKEGGQR